MGSDYPVILFDGVCNLCNGSVQFIIRHDPKASIRFAALQSAYGQEQLEKYNINHAGSTFDSIILIENGIYQKSEAVLRIAVKLKGWPSLFVVGRILPRFIRDAMYDFVAKRRYAVFGKQESCMIPTPELRSRFLG